MPRPPRIHVEGGFYHVILRGNHREDMLSESLELHLRRDPAFFKQPLALELARYRNRKTETRHRRFHDEAGSQSRHSSRTSANSMESIQSNWHFQAATNDSQIASADRSSRSRASNRHDE
jgi:hypothetical protein